MRSGRKTLGLMLTPENIPTAVLLQPRGGGLKPRRSLHAFPARYELLLHSFLPHDDLLQQPTFAELRLQVRKCRMFLGEMSSVFASDLVPGFAADRLTEIGKEFSRCPIVCGTSRVD